MRRQEEIFKCRVPLWYFLVFIFINFRHVKSSINKQLLAKFQGEQLLICHVPCIAQINIHLSLIPVFNIHRKMYDEQTNVKTLEYFAFDLVPRFFTKDFSTYLFRYLKSPFQGNNSKKITTREAIMRIEKLNERKITSLLNKISSVDMIIILEWSEPNAFHTLSNHTPYSIRATHDSTYVISINNIKMDINFI